MKFILSRGPQDGAYVEVSDPPPVRLFVGKNWKGDGYASWGRERCERFPACYLLDMTEDKYTFLE